MNIEKITRKNDSRPDTLAHIARVQTLLHEATDNLNNRAVYHDLSKLREPELSGFDTVKEKLSALVYGSEEYKAALAELKPTLDLHYAANSHHPEHFVNGVDGMSLFDLVEMLLDWKAATERMKDGDIRRSIEINAERFKLSPQLKGILLNTLKEMGW